MNPIIGTLTDTVTNATTVEKSAEELINGFAARQQSAIDQAIGNGATAEQLQPLTDLNQALKDESDALAAAVAANTPAAAKRK